MSIKINVGVLDRLLRLAVSAVLFYLALYYPATADDSVTSVTLLVAVAINSLVALIGICPVYMALGVNTARQVALQRR